MKCLYQGDHSEVAPPLTGTDSMERARHLFGTVCSRLMFEELEDAFAVETCQTVTQLEKFYTEWPAF